jgi:Bacteriophage tail sheath protein
MQPPPAIDGVATDTAGFVGAVGGGLEPLRTLADFDRVHGGEPGALRDAAGDFFAQGGRTLFCSTALTAFEELAEIAIVAAPGDPARHAELIEHAERMRFRVAVLDPPPALTVAEVGALAAELETSHAALYYPWVDGRAPSGFVAGVYSRVEPFEPPVGPLAGVTALDAEVSGIEQESLNAVGVSCLRAFPGRGIEVWGARTLSSDPEWKYVNVRRYLAYLEHSIEQGLGWVFEPNDASLWARVRSAVEAFLDAEWRRGGLAGARPGDAYFVRCDQTTMTQSDIDAGRLVCLVGAAPIKPAEFVNLRIGLWTADRPDP